MAAATPLIHVGYHKTGSTWLQTSVFPEETCGFCVPWEAGREEAIKQFVRVNPFDFDAAKARAAFAPGLEAACDRSVIPVISHEGLVGNPMRGDYWGREVAERMSRTFAEAKILICIREQKSMLLSLYRQYIRHYWGDSGIDWFIERRDFGDPAYQPCRLHHLEYDYLIRCYQDLFGKENVLVLPFELLQEDNLAFVKRIWDLMGVHPRAMTPRGALNVSLKGVELALRRRVNRFVPSAWRRSIGRRAIPVCRMIGRATPRRVNDWADHSNTAFVAERVAGYYRGSNEKTSEMTGLDLRAYGYDCPLSG